MRKTLAFLLCLSVLSIDQYTTLTCRTSMYISSVRDLYSSTLFRGHLDYWILAFGSFSHRLYVSVAMLAWIVAYARDGRRIGILLLIAFFVTPELSSRTLENGFLIPKGDDYPLWIVTLEPNLGEQETVQAVCSTMKSSVVLRWYPVTKTYLAYMSPKRAEEKKKATGEVLYVTRWNVGD
jgi:hypothetical protein